MKKTLNLSRSCERELRFRLEKLRILRTKTVGLKFCNSLSTSVRKTMLVSKQDMLRFVT